MKDKLLDNKSFPYIIGFTALLIAGCAAGFSVYGIGNLFAGAAISAMIMAGCLEIGKLVATTFLYRYWHRSVFLVKSYLSIAVIALMIITSAGIFGFLSAAYQKSSLEFKLNQERIVSIELSKGFYTNQISISGQRINVLNDVRKVQEGRLSEALTNVFLARNPIQLQQIQEQTIKMIDQANNDIKTENDKVEQGRAKLLSIDETINEMKITASGKKDIQTFKFLADALHTDLDTVAKWFIISLIFVFDPMAIALILAYNVVVFKRKEESSIIEPPTQVQSPTPIYSPLGQALQQLSTKNPPIKEPEIPKDQEDVKKKVETEKVEIKKNIPQVILPPTRSFKFNLVPTSSGSISPITRSLNEMVEKSLNEFSSSSSKSPEIDKTTTSTVPDAAFINAARDERLNPERMSEYYRLMYKQS